MSKIETLKNEILELSTRLAAQSINLNATQDELEKAQKELAEAEKEEAKKSFSPRLYVNLYRRSDNSYLSYSYSTDTQASKEAASYVTRRAVPYVEDKPVQITDELTSRWYGVSYCSRNYKAVLKAAFDRVGISAVIVNEESDHE